MQQVDYNDYDSLDAEARRAEEEKMATMPNNLVILEDHKLAKEKS